MFLATALSFVAGWGACRNDPDGQIRQQDRAAADDAERGSPVVRQQGGGPEPAQAGETAGAADSADGWLGLMAPIQIGDEWVRPEYVVLCDLEDTLLLGSDGRLLRDPSYAVRGMRGMGYGESVEELMQLVEQGGVRHRKLGMRALGAIGDKRALSVLLPALRDSDAAAFSGLYYQRVYEQSRLTDPPGTFTIRLMHNYRLTSLGSLALWPNNLTAARAVGDIGDADAVPDLLALLREPECEIKGALADALGKIGDPTALPGLRELLQDATGAQEEDVAHWARRAIIQIEAQQKDPAALIQDLDSEDVYVTYYAVLGLGARGDEEAVAALRGLFADERIVTRDATLPTIFETIGHAAEEAAEAIERRVAQPATGGE